MNQIQGQVLSSTKIIPAVYLLWIQAPEVASAAEPGQFVMMHCGSKTDPLLRRPFSIHRATEDRIAILFKVVGDGTERIANYHQGDSIDLIGPLGKGFCIDSEASHLLLICGGIGIAPLFFLAEKALDVGKSVTLLSGASTASQLYPRDKIPSQICLHQVTEDGSEGNTGMVTDIVTQHANLANPTTQVFACGPLSMYQTMSHKTEFEGKAVQISLEVRMGCGIGICHGCSIKTKLGAKRACLDGPVFDLHDILWEQFDTP